MKRVIQLALMSVVILYFGVFTLTARENSPEPTPLPEPGKWERLWLDRVQEFRAENNKLNEDEEYIIFLGDSLTQAYDLEKYFPGLPALNRGIVSDGVAPVPESPLPWRGVTHRMKESLYDCQPSHLFFLIGANDVGRKSIPYEYWLGNYKYVIRQARKKFPEIKIILLTCSPTGTAYRKTEYLNKRLAKWNIMIKQCAEEENCRLIDLHNLFADKNGLLPEEMTKDGLHFNDMGYAELTKKVKKILREDGIIEKRNKQK